jgi:isocitrate dehydrogenase (NAD+)
MILPRVELISRKMADGLFLSTARDVAKDYPDISFDAELLDNTCLRVLPNTENV